MIRKYEATLGFDLAETQWEVNDELFTKDLAMDYINMYRINPSDKDPIDFTVKEYMRIYLTWRLEGQHKDEVLRKMPLMVDGVHEVSEEKGFKVLYDVVTEFSQENLHFERLK